MISVHFGFSKKLLDSRYIFFFLHVEFVPSTLLAKSGKNEVIILHNHNFPGAMLRMFIHCLIISQYYYFIIL